jgi:hypothetical protein
MWRRSRGAKNWMTAMAVLFVVMAVIVVLREIALWGPEFVMDDFVSAAITNEKIALLMFGIAAVLFAVGIKKGEELHY